MKKGMSNKWFISCTIIATTIISLSLQQTAYTPLDEVNTTLSIDRPPLTDHPIFPKSSNPFIFKHTMKITIRYDFTVKVTSSLVLENKDIQPVGFFLFVINKTISSPFVSDPIDNLVFKPIMLSDSILLNITLRYPLVENHYYFLTITYDVNDPIIHIETPVDYYQFEYLLSHYSETGIFILEASLPIYHDILINENILAVYPAAIRKIEDGIVKITWTTSNILTHYEYLYQVRFVEADYIPTFSPPAEIPPAFYALIAFAFFGGIGISSMLFYIVIKKKFQPSKRGLVSSLLSEAEQAVIQAINDEGGMTIQQKICKRTGYSKSKVSQILLKLEEKNVLKRERWGRTNRVKITNQSFINIELENVPPPEEKEDDW